MRKRFYPKHIREKRKRLIVLILFVIFALSVGSLLLYLHDVSVKEEWEVYIDNNLNFSFEYPSYFRPSSLSKKALEAGYLLELKRDNPSALFNIRYEDDLGIMKILGRTIFDTLVEVVNRRYPDRFPNYEKLSYKEILVDGRKAGQWDFTYLGSDGKTIVRQRFVLVVLDDSAFYISMQAPLDKFSKSENDFERMLASFKFQAARGRRGGD